jgi:hypothetical protein
MPPNYHVAKLARCATLSTVNLAIENDSGTHAFGNQNQNEIPRVVYLRPAKPKLGKGDSVGIIVYNYWQRDRSRDNFRNRNIPPLEIRDIEGIPCRWIHQARQTYTHSLY